MVSESPERFVNICTDIAMASEGAISYSYLMDCPLYEVLIIKKKVNEINTRRQNEATAQANRNR